MNRPRDDEYLTIQQAAKYLSIPEPVLRLTIRCGKISASHLQGRHQPCVRKGDLRPFLNPLSEGRDRRPETIAANIIDAGDGRIGKRTATKGTAQGKEKCGWAPVDQCPEHARTNQDPESRDIA